ncbi:MAG: hypothetical protein KIT69_13330 [Propionibacteriaceae bacterium]|nr:hypothetical protein [Propionibacteriaceae bacterium]
MNRARRFVDRGWLTLAAGLVAALVFAALWLARATVPFVPDPSPVQQGETASTPGASFVLRGMTTIDAMPQGQESVPPMPGASLVAVRLDHSSETGSEVSCLVELLGDDRKWRDDRIASVKDWGFSSHCEGTSGKVLKIFEIPTTAVAEIRGVRVWSGEGSVILAGEVEIQ